MEGLQLPPLDAAIAERLRFENEAMVAAYFAALRDELGPGAIVGLYAKGSACKPWESLIDYVPEVSDVDIHVRFADGEEGTRLMRSLDFALRVAERALAAFSARVPDALHVPRPQLLSLHALEALPGFLPVPGSSVRTIHGPPYAAPSRDDYRATHAGDAERFAADARYVSLELAEKVVDRPGHHAWRAISLIAWRVSPSAPRLLTHLGMHPYDAWSLNRTSAARELHARGRAALAAAYAGFYLACWEGFRSGFRSAGAARDALRAVERLYAEGSRIIPAAVP